jgi:hypothetical protein
MHVSTHKISTYEPASLRNAEVPSAYQCPEGKENTGSMCWNFSLALNFVTPCSPHIISILRLPGVGLAEYPLENSKKKGKEEKKKSYQDGTSL